MMDINVSIIIPVFNEAETIKKCIDSILRQTLKKIEIIIVDDGSTDESIEIIANYQKDNENILLFHQPNLGAGPARNLALTKATGEYICFMDADDYYNDENALLMMYSHSKKENVNVSCGLMKFDYDGVLVEAGFHRDIINKEETRIIKFGEYQSDVFFQCYMIKREMIKRERFEFMALRRYQDPPFLVSVLDYAQNILIVNIEFYCYRKTKNKIYFDKEKTNDMVRGLKWELAFVQERGYSLLVKNILQRLNKTYAEYIINNLNNNFELLCLLLDINKMVDGKELVLDILKYLVHMTEKEQYESFFIRNRINVGIGKEKKIILYGAGEHGKDVYNALKNTDNIVTAWVDKFKTGEIIADKKIKSIEDIKKIEYDFIFITVENSEMCKVIERELIDNNCLPQKLVFWNEIMA